MPGKTGLRCYLWANDSAWDTHWRDDSRNYSRVLLSPSPPLVPRGRFLESLSDRRYSDCGWRAGLWQASLVPWVFSKYMKSPSFVFSSHPTKWCPSKNSHPPWCSWVVAFCRFCDQWLRVLKDVQRKDPYAGRGSCTVGQQRRPNHGRLDGAPRSPNCIRCLASGVAVSGWSWLLGEHWSCRETKMKYVIRKGGWCPFCQWDDYTIVMGMVRDPLVDQRASILILSVYSPLIFRYLHGAVISRTFSVWGVSSWECLAVSDGLHSFSRLSRASYHGPSPWDTNVILSTSLCFLATVLAGHDMRQVLDVRTHHLDPTPGF